MLQRLARFIPTRRSLRLGLVLGGVALVGVGGYLCRGLFVPPAAAQQAPGTVDDEPAPNAPGEYASRVVAYVHGSQAVTRQELGEYLIHRYGYDKLPLMLNRRLVDAECRRRGILVTAAEVEATFVSDLKAQAITTDQFVKTVLPRYNKTLYEFKEDVLRPRVQMSRLVADRLAPTADELNKAFQAAYGDKVECRIIVWPITQAKEASEEYARLRDNEDAFAEKAKNQKTSDLAASGGKIAPIGRYLMHPVIEAAAFKLRPGECSTLLDTPQGICMLKCDKVIPADKTVTLASVRDKLDAQLREKKLQIEMASLFASLREQGKPTPSLVKLEKAPTGPMPAPSAVVAFIHGQRPVTREDLGEFLIARYGAEKVEFLVNRKIILAECAARGVTLDEAEVDKGMEADLKLLNVDKKIFEKELLNKYGKNIFEWREDVVKARLLLTALCKHRVKVTEDDIKKGFDAYYGERMEARLILWPPDQAKFALSEYARIRDSAEEFDRKAKSQNSPTLAAKGGLLPVFGRNTLGDARLEEEAFKLAEGELSTLIETPQGQVVIKCVKRIPADKSVTLSAVRDKLHAEAFDRKVQIEMQTAFKELRDKADPRLILKSSTTPEDLIGDSSRLLNDTPAPRK